jgi:D-arabinose 1-dehydrogenase-like Zn-dependent alcohol dehydrogenase
LNRFHEDHLLRDAGEATRRAGAGGASDAASSISEVLIEVQACGICGTDASDIERVDPVLQPSRVSGHERVGRITAPGQHIPSIWKVG